MPSRCFALQWEGSAEHVVAEEPKSHPGNNGRLVERAESMQPVPMGTPAFTRCEKDAP